MLDLAITPSMVRDALQESTTLETGEALLRHFVRKRSCLEADRDKTDFVVTFLYRQMVPANRQVRYPLKVDEPSVFEEEMHHILDAEPVPLPEEHRQLVREFPFIQQEVEDYVRFDQLMDSGVIQCVRDIKQRFGASFYHPRVLVTIAAYNVYFRSRFDQLFSEAAQQIKKFAADVQEQGASILSRVNGDITVQHLTEVEKREREILEGDYGRAQEHFRNISKLKKAVDSRNSSLRSAPVFTHAETGNPAVYRSAMPPPDHDLPTGVTGAIEVAKLKNMEDAICTFVSAADPKCANVVPIEGGNLPLSNAEVEAFRANYGGEKSYRAEYAAAIRQSLAIIARIQVEQREYILKQRSAYLWKPHADSMTFLINTAQRLQEQCGSLLGMAEHRGLSDKVTAMSGTLQKMRLQVQAAAKALQEAGN